MIRGFALFIGLLCAGPVAAIELSMPNGARQISDRDSALDSYAMPVAPWVDGSVDTVMVEGRVERQSWRVESGSITTLQILDPLRAQVQQLGFETLIECDAALCGGFDFRFAIEVIPTPDMFVDIRDYRFFAAQNGDQAISLLVSRGRTAGYIQVIQVAPRDEAPPQIVEGGEPLPIVQEEEPLDLASLLIDQGHVTLEDLTFETGSSTLSEGEYHSLQALAEFMEENPSAIIAVVGHTDATGDLGINIRVSRQRAQAVRTRLVQQFDISEDRLQAEGMGYLAPRASNLTAEGRDQNRRVEAVILSLE